MCFENSSRFFKLELTAQEFFYFCEVRHYEKYAQVRICHAKLFNNINQGDQVWHNNVLEVSGRCEGNVDSRKVGGMSNARDILLKPLVNKLEDHDLLCEVVRARSSSPDERQRDANIPLKVRLVEAKKARASFALAKGSHAVLAANLEVGKFNPVGDASISDLLKMNFLSSMSTCSQLVNHIRQAGDLDTLFGARLLLPLLLLSSTSLRRRMLN
ncbi:unnamed protein product [Prunus armeniaca]